MNPKNISQLTQLYQELQIAARKEVVRELEKKFAKEKDIQNLLKLRKYEETQNEN